MSDVATRILGVFPAMDAIGGVQTSGREAWLSIVGHVGDHRARLFSYTQGTSRLGAAFKALRSSSRSDVVFVWHSQLLKLVPLLDGTAARVIVFLHGIEAWKQHDTLNRWALQRVRLFLSNSDHTWERFLDFNPDFRTARHQTVHLGAGTSLSERAPGPSGLPVAVMIGRMSRGEDYKGHRQMIEAWPLIRERLPQAQLWIVGDGDLRRDLEQLAVARGLGHKIHFWGSVSDTVKDNLIAKSRCLALPSRGEGFGLVYLEAMRSGRPCMVSNFDAGREVVNPPEAGLAVDPDNLDEVAEAACRLLTPGPEWNQWSLQARLRYESRFTAKHFHERLLAAVFEP